MAKRVKGNDGDMSLPTLTISAGSGWLDQKDRFSGNIAGSEQKNYTLLKRGQLSYNHGNSKLAKYGAVFVLRTYEKALVPRVYHSFTMLNNADADFIEFLFATKIPDKELVKKITSGARTDGLLNISFEGFMDIAITIPTLPEQQKIGALFRRLDRLITLHKRKLLEKYNKNNTKFLQNVTHQQSVLKLCCITFNPIIERTSLCN
ncbi:restriction endonuclease subunit S [Avibacterium paragallinarum]|uniref:restriction endonuclease subunit S n=1 Tax=Avibacterium paragallinarum TaxID=728 RepID=UPI0039FC5389